MRKSTLSFSPSSRARRKPCTGFPSGGRAVSVAFSSLLCVPVTEMQEHNTDTPGSWAGADAD